MRNFTIQSLLLLLFSVWTLTPAWGQQVTVTGNLTESKTGLPVEYASVALLRTDSSVVAVNRTDENGYFSLSGSASESRILKISQVGFKTWTENLVQESVGDTLHLGNLSMISTENMLNMATVSATLARVEQKGDTTQFNAGAYRVPQGSTLQTLIKQLPGVEVSEDGKITWNGKEVKEFLVNGKDFFKGDTDIAMKNLPTEIVSRIKAYDKKSDYTELTGIDDGEERTVLDIATKRKLEDSWVTQVDGGYGNHGRYTGRAFLSRFGEQLNLTAYGTMNNINDRTIGEGYHAHQANGLQTNKSAGISFSWENKKEKKERNRFEIEGDLNYSHININQTGTTNSETFLSAGKSQSFQNAWRHHTKSSTDIASDFRIKWNLSPVTTLTFRPSYSYTSNQQTQQSLSATFTENPFSLPGMTHPLDSIFSDNPALLHPALYQIWLNTNHRLSLNEDWSHYVGGTLEITHRLKKPKRTLSLMTGGGYTHNESESFSISDIKYNAASSQTPKFLNQYSTMPSKKYDYKVRATYTEPFGKGWNLRVGYMYAYKHTQSDRSRYNLDSLAYEPYRHLYPGYEDFGNPENYPALGIIPLEDEVLNAVRDLRNSQYATYDYMDHSIILGLRYKSRQIRLFGNVKINPEYTRMRYNRPGQHIDTLITRHIFKLAPSLRFKYKFSETSQFEANYYGYSSQPSMTNLLAVVDDSNPLNISMGNPGLEPSWNNKMNLSFNTYLPQRQQNFMSGLYFNHISNSVSNRMIYDEQTGIRYTRPENIDGNWNLASMFMFSSGLGKKKLFNISTMTTVSYNNAVGYTGRLDNGKDSRAAYASPMDVPATGHHNYDYYEKLFAASESVKNTTRDLSLSENLKTSYRGEWYEIGLKGKVHYQHARATVQKNADIDSWKFSYGSHASLNFNFGLNLYTEIQMDSRRGYNDAAMNTNELIWNAQISQSFLRNKAATLSIDLYDILHRQTSISRQLTATQRIDSWNQSVNSFFMVRFTYQLNIFNGGQKKDKKIKHPSYNTHPGMRMSRMRLSGHP